MFYGSFCYEILTALVWLVGVIVAIRRWKRHPQVSAAVLVSLACMMVAVGSQTVVLYLLFNFMPRPATNVLMLYMSLLGVLCSLIRAVGWAAIVVAIFGWRGDLGAAERRWSLQFSIRNLLVLTLAVGVLCGLMRGLVDLLGESAVVLLGLLDELPMAICWLLGGWLAWTRRKRHPEVARRVAIAIAIHVATLLLGIATVLWMFTAGPSEWFIVYFFIAVIAGPASWALLLTAAFGWRTLESPFKAAVSSELEQAHARHP